jgi:hypothetical protein
MESADTNKISVHGSCLTVRESACSQITSWKEITPLELKLTLESKINSNE